MKTATRAAGWPAPSATPHYLKAGRPAGHVLWQGIYRTDTETDCPELVAVLCWGGAAIITAPDPMPVCDS